MKAARFLSALCLIVLISTLFLAAYSGVSAEQADSKAISPTLQDGGGAEFKVIDVATPTGRLMKPDQIAKLLRTYVQWGFQRYGDPYQKFGRWWQIIRRTAEARGPVTGGAGVAITWHFEGMCPVYNYGNVPATWGAYVCDCWKRYWNYMSRTYGTDIYNQYCR